MRKRSWIVVLGLLCLLGTGGGLDLSGVSSYPPPQPSLHIIKEFSLDNVTWRYDCVFLVAGTTIYWRFTVQNNGNVPLTDVVVYDSKLGVVGTVAFLGVGETAVFYASSTVQPGLQENEATARGYYGGTIITSPPAMLCYFGLQANDDAYEVNANERLIVGPPGVMENDHYKGAWWLGLVTNVKYGTLHLRGYGLDPWWEDGSFTYIPNPNFCGQDYFVYRICVQGVCDEATVWIRVICPLDAVDDFYTTHEDTTLIVPAPGVLGNDSYYPAEVRSFTVVSGPANGTLTLNPDGSFIYVPAPNWYGTDTFTYRLCNADGDCDEATVTITVAFVNDPPEAENMILRTCINEATRFTVTVMDPDILWDGFAEHPITFTLVSGPEHGTVAADWANVVYEAGKASVEIVYAPKANFVGDDIFVIRAADPYGEFVLIMVRITVERCGLGPAGAAGFVRGPVVIHEIAWAGTSASPEDQWIELLNVSDSPVDLTGWTLRWRKKNPQTPEDLIWREIKLTGVLAPYGFFLLERGSDEVVRNIQADLIYPATMRVDKKEIPLLFSNDGDIIQLLDAEGQVVDTANADPQVKNWAAGSPVPATMERRSPLLPDTLENWWTNIGVVAVGKDRNEVWLQGTARALNEPEVFALAGEAIAVERGQKVELTKRLAQAAEEPRVAVIRGDVLGGAGTVVPFAPEIVVVRYEELLNLAAITVNTKDLEPGVYTVVVILGADVYVISKITVR